MAPRKYIGGQSFRYGLIKGPDVFLLESLIIICFCLRRKMAAECQASQLIHHVAQNKKELLLPNR